MALRETPSNRAAACWERPIRLRILRNSLQHTDRHDIAIIYSCNTSLSLWKVYAPPMESGTETETRSRTWRRLGLSVLLGTVFAIGVVFFSVEAVFLVAAHIVFVAWIIALLRSR